MSNEQDAPDVSDLPIQDAVNLLRGGTSFDDLAAASDGGISSQTLQRMADAHRPFTQPPYPKTLIAAADALNRSGKTRTTPWALWTALGIQFERTDGLWGRPNDRAAGALGLLPHGWVDLSHDRFATWVRSGAALISEQRAEAHEEEVRGLRADLARAQERIAQLEAPRKPRRA